MGIFAIKIGENERASTRSPKPLHRRALLHGSTAVGVSVGLRFR